MLRCMLSIAWAQDLWNGNLRIKGDTDDQTDWTLKAYLFRDKPDEQATGKQVGGRGQAAKETSAPSKDRGIEMKPRGVDSFI